MLPSPDILNEFEFGKYVLSNLAAKRAKQLREGAPPLVSIDSYHPLTIALAEIAAGKIKPIFAAGAESAELGEVVDHALISEEPLPAELGMLLPALDETEVALVGAAAIGDDEHVEEAEHDEDVVPEVSLADMVAEEDEEEPAPTVGEDDTLSLSDIADQEGEEDEESGE